MCLRAGVIDSAAAFQEFVHTHDRCASISITAIARKAQKTRTARDVQGIEMQDTRKRSLAEPELMLGAVQAYALIAARIRPVRVDRDVESASPPPTALPKIARRYFGAMAAHGEDELLTRGIVKSAPAAER